MAASTQVKTIFDQLDEAELSMVSSFASSLIRNRGDHTEAYHKFQAFRKEMLEKNPMSADEIDKIIHDGENK